MTLDREESKRTSEEDGKDYQNQIEDTNKDLNLATDREKEDKRDPTMKERKRNLDIVKLNANCPKDCNSRDCSLRMREKRNVKCNCQSIAQHCYYCYAHLCLECSTKQDVLEAGVRKCKPGECKIPLESEDA